MVAVALCTQRCTTFIRRKTSFLSHFFFISSVRSYSVMDVCCYCCRADTMRSHSFIHSFDSLLSYSFLSKKCLFHLCQCICRFYHHLKIRTDSAACAIRQCVRLIEMIACNDYTYFHCFYHRSLKVLAFDSIFFAAIQ